MGLRLLKPLRRVIFGVRRRTQRYHERVWLKRERMYWKTAGTFYRNIAGEKFKVTRDRFLPLEKEPGVFKTRITVSVLKGNFGLEQTTRVFVYPKKRVIDIADVNEGVTSRKKPAVSLRDRNLFQVIFDEAEAIGREQFGNSEFKLRIAPSNRDLRKLYKRFGFRDYDDYSHDMEFIVHAR